MESVSFKVTGLGSATLVSMLFADNIEYN